MYYRQRDEITSICHPQQEELQACITTQDGIKAMCYYRQHGNSGMD